MPFDPGLAHTLTIDGTTYLVAEHPAAPGVAYGQEGRAAVVYQVVDPHSTPCALKVFRPRYRVPALVTIADKLAAFANIPGLSVCRRTVLTSRKHTELLRQYPDLTYAVLMPWVYGPTWMEVMLEQRPLTPEQSLRLAHTLLHLLAEMEERGLAHCDLSGPNVILPALAAKRSANSSSDVALVDVEQMFGPDLNKPEILPGGSAGYAHKPASTGLWSSNADRFAGAILLAEILGWCDERVRRSATGESYFAPDELQHDSTRYQCIVTSLSDYWGAGVANLVERAWHSETSGDCPTFGEWLVTLPESVPAAASRRDVEAEWRGKSQADGMASARAPVETPQQRSMSAMPKCYFCGESISAAAPICPACGRRNRVGNTTSESTLDKALAEKVVQDLQGDSFQGKMTALEYLSELKPPNESIVRALKGMAQDDNQKYFRDTAVDLLRSLGYETAEKEKTSKTLNEPVKAEYSRPTARTNKGLLEQFMEQFPTPVQTVLYLVIGGFLILISYSMTNIGWTGAAIGIASYFSFFLGGLMIIAGMVKVVQSVVNGIQILLRARHKSK